MISMLIGFGIFFMLLGSYAILKDRAEDKHSDMWKVAWIIPACGIVLVIIGSI